MQPVPACSLGQLVTHVISYPQLFDDLTISPENIEQKIKNRLPVIIEQFTGKAEMVTANTKITPESLSSGTL